VLICICAALPIHVILAQSENQTNTSSLQIGSMYRILYDVDGLKPIGLSGSTAHGSVMDSHKYLASEVFVSFQEHIKSSLKNNILKYPIVNLLEGPLNEKNLQDELNRALTNNELTVQKNNDITKEISQKISNITYPILLENINEKIHEIVEKRLKTKPDDAADSNTALWNLIAQKVGSKMERELDTKTPSSAESSLSERAARVGVNEAVDTFLRGFSKIMQEWVTEVLKESIEISDALDRTIQYQVELSIKRMPVFVQIKDGKQQKTKLDAVKLQISKFIIQQINQFFDTEIRSNLVNNIRELQQGDLVENVRNDLATKYINIINSNLCLGRGSVIQLYPIVNDDIGFQVIDVEKPRYSETYKSTAKEGEFYSAPISHLSPKYLRPEWVLTTGILVVPFRIWPQESRKDASGDTAEAYHISTASLTVGPFLGVRNSLMPLCEIAIENCVFLGTLGLTQTEANYIDGTTSSESALSISIGHIWVLSESFQFGFVLGIDKLADSKKDDKWIYKNKPWISVAIGSLFIDL